MNALEKSLLSSVSERSLDSIELGKDLADLKINIPIEGKRQEKTSNINLINLSSTYESSQKDPKQMTETDELDAFLKGIDDYS